MTSQEYESSVSILKGQLSSQSVELAEACQRETQLTATTDSLRRQALAASDENKQLLQSMGTLEEERAALLVRANKLEADVEQGKAEVDVLEERISELQIELEDAEKQRTMQETVVKELQLKVQEFKSSLESARKDDVLGRLKNQELELEALQERNKVLEEEAKEMKTNLGELFRVIPPPPFFFSQY